MCAAVEARPVTVFRPEHLATRSALVATYPDMDTWRGNQINCTRVSLLFLFSYGHVYQRSAVAQSDRVILCSVPPGVPLPRYEHTHVSDDSQLHASNFELVRASEVTHAGPQNMLPCHAYGIMKTR